MLEKLRGGILIGVIVLRELQRKPHQVQAVHGHPACAIGLINITTGGQWSAPVENSDIIQAEKSTLQDVESGDVFSVYPPGKIEKQLMEDTFKKRNIPRIVWFLDTPVFTINFKNSPSCPGVHRRVYITECPLVRR